MARMYDYALDGKDNFEADREAVRNLFRLSPENKDVPKVNRRFLGRAVRYVALNGIDQFLDLGAGLPSQGNVHEVAQVARSGARVAYIDNDPVVLAHGRALLAWDDTTTVIQADIRDPEAILDHPEVARLIDFSRPVAVLFVAILHGISDTDDPAGIVRAFADRMVTGSHLILSHLTSDGHPPALVAQKEEVFARSPTPFRYRTREEILRYFDGFDLVEPGLTPVTRWRPGGEDTGNHAAGAWWLGGVGVRTT